jgi:Ca2+-transporting ATPase
MVLFGGVVIRVVVDGAHLNYVKPAMGPWLLLAGAVLLVLGALAVAYYMMDFDHERAVTVSFLTLAFGKLWFVFNLRSPGSRLFTNEIVRNRYVLGALLLCALLLAAAVYLPPLADLLKTREPGGTGWLLLLGMGLVPFIWGQAIRSRQAAPSIEKE